MSDSPKQFAISVVIPTHNPRMDYLARVLDALRGQTLDQSAWELVVVDNNSQPELRVVGPKDEKTKRPKDKDNYVDLSWHGNARIVREERVGLTNARLRGFAETMGEVVVLVDDDNLLAPDYLEQVVRIAREYPFLGTWSGNVTLELEPGSEEPRRELRHLLCERTVERDVWSNDPRHLAANPWGAGECIRREVAEAYAALVEKEPRRRQLDLQGQDLVYGGDTDIAYTGCKHGWGMGVFAALRVTHLTPKGRCTDDYLLRRYEGQAFSNVLHHWVETGGLSREQRHPLRQAGALVRWLSRGSFYRAMVAAERRGRGRAIRFIGSMPECRAIIYEK
jgi:glycosyltransferase involved in cell wall biosynthesis